MEGTFLPITPRQAMEGIVAIAVCEVKWSVDGFGSQPRLLRSARLRNV